MAKCATCIFLEKDKRMDKARFLANYNNEVKTMRFDAFIQTCRKHVHNVHNFHHVMKKFGMAKCYFKENGFYLIVCQWLLHQVLLITAILSCCSQHYVYKDKTLPKLILWSLLKKHKNAQLQCIETLINSLPIATWDKQHKQILDWNTGHQALRSSATDHYWMRHSYRLWIWRLQYQKKRRRKYLYVRQYNFSWFYINIKI